jgi:hypothetical protein
MNTANFWIFINLLKTLSTTFKQIKEILRQVNEIIFKIKSKDDPCSCKVYFLLKIGTKKIPIERLGFYISKK